MVIMLMVIDRQSPRAIQAKQGQIGRIAGDVVGMPGTAHMAIQTHHLVSGGHDQMQFMRHHQDAATALSAQVADQIVQLVLAGQIYALNRFIEHQQVRLAQ